MKKQHLWWIISFLIGFGISAIVHAETGYWSMQETVTDMEETYNEVVGTVTTDVLDEQGNPTGETITRPITESRVRRWKEETRKPDVPGFKAFGNFPLTEENKKHFLGHSPHDLRLKGEWELLKNVIAIHYWIDTPDGPVKLYNTYRQWDSQGRPQAAGTDLSCHVFVTSSGTSDYFPADDCTELLKQ